jgi:serine/threonine kinase 16
VWRILTRPIEYRVVVGAEIAQGGYSYVYHARDATTGEAFALKKILCQTEEQIAMAKQEIETHRSFMHVGLMPLSDYAVVSLDVHTLEYYLLFPFMEVRIELQRSQ